MTTDPSIPPSNGTCHFLRLSGELRNIVYAYALHEPAGIHYSMKDGGKLHVRNHDENGAGTTDVEGNQIMFTCRRLHQETRGVGIRYNDIYFDHPLDAGYFLDSYAKSGHRHLQTLFIAEGNVCASTTCAYTARLMQLCLDQPHITVRHHSLELDTAHAHFVFNAIRHEAFLRGSTSLVDKFVTNPRFRPFTITSVQDAAQQLRASVLT
jgi:hypothetical protein